MSDRDSQIYNALLNATSLDAREKDIVTEAWLLAKKSHDALSSAWTASREKIRRAENDTEDKACWAKFEGVRAQYALIDKFDQRKEQLARRWRPPQVIDVDEDWEDIASEDGTRDDAAEASPKAVKVRNIDPQKPVQNSDDMSAGFQASTPALLQLGLDKIVGLDAIVPPTGSIPGGQQKQGNKRWPAYMEEEYRAAKKNKTERKQRVRQRHLRSPT
ncbi:hypothetical protein CKAH01_11245 [Colletotrichum kahawae]|uniref:Uncharacterized protein n=1 Tax=Colletotrichum kahawae TaxID=34407 RepID=A0AAE0CWL6_COLKA|nr:hypothetical protein CKAH01_11245 [Colletotrichum kahawae]